MRLIDISPYEIGAMSCSVQTTKQESATTMSVTQINTNTIPTIDAAPVVLGEWIWTERGADDYEQYFVCSKCGQQQYVETNYCPDCGAKMDGGKEDG